MTAAIAALLIVDSGVAIAAPTSVSNGPVSAHTVIVKPLTLSKVSDIDFGSIIVQDNGTVTMTAATGAISCPSTLTCSASGTPAEYKITGTNNQVVNITKPNVVLSNAGNPGTPLTLVLTGPTQVTLPNSGAAGTNFRLGGTIAISAASKDGVYTGVLNVTVDYN
jgi:Mat/Ecp fimbriae major subunit